MTQVRKTTTLYCADGVAMAIIAAVSLAIVLTFVVVAIVVNWS